MEMTVSGFGGVDVIRVEVERVDASVAIQFKDVFRDLTRNSSGPVVLDLSRVVFLDSSGLGAVVAARKLLGESGRLELAELSPAVDKVMCLTRMNTVFPIHETLSDALAAHGVAPAA